MKHSLSIIEVPCDQIQIGDRHRKRLGDLEALAASIEADGLLQPIGITEDHQLVFGERRLRAVRDVLKRSAIPARVVHVRSITAGEYAENELRKDFTASERVAIGKVLEPEFGERRGRDNPENTPEFKGRETREIAAQAAGFGNPKTYEQAKQVVKHGSPELVAAMDAGDISIHAASLIASEPQDRQTEIVQMPKELRRKILREIRKAADLPTPGEARRLARETGMSVADNTGVYRSGSSPEEVKAAKADVTAIYTVTRGILSIANTSFDPTALAARLDYWHCPDIRKKSTTALDWLGRFVKGLETNDKIR